MTFQVQAAGLSHVGQVRSDNEDMLLLEPDLQIFAVADGMGGHAAGEVASQIAVDSLKEVWLHPADGEDEEERMLRAFSVANTRIREEVARNAARHGMGTTMVAAGCAGSHLQLAHVGDSRIYLVRNGAMEQLTRDHSWVREQIDMGKLSPDEAASHPFRNVITRALGTRTQVQVDLQKLSPEAGDRLLLCSDGLTTMLDDATIREIILDAGDAEAAVDQLISCANEAGGEDNVTAVLLQFEA